MKRILLEKEPHLEIIEDCIDSELCNQIVQKLKENEHLFSSAKMTEYSTGLINPDRTIDGHMAVYNENLEALDRTGFNKLVKQVIKILSEVTGYPVENFNEPVATMYKPGSSFVSHYDFFMVNDEAAEKNIKNLLRRGGNRLATAVLYLNNDYSGGETYFNHLYKSIYPNVGQVAFWRYDYDDPESNIKTAHSGKEIIHGTKYILTFFVKEHPYETIVESVNPRTEERDFLYSYEDINYQLECGPDWDRRILDITLPANAHPDHTIGVGLSGMDSFLALYLISMLNKLHNIPYRIVPIIVVPNLRMTSDWGQDWKTIHNLYHMAKEIINEPFLHRLIDCQIPYESSYKFGCRDTLVNFYNKKDTRWPERHRYLEPKFIVTGDHERPVLDEEWAAHGAPFIKSPVDWWIQPFHNLQKYHIIDLYHQLGMVEQLKNSGSCLLKHNDPYELNCANYACNERRWALMTLGKYDLVPYLLADWRPIHENS